MAFPERIVEDKISDRKGRRMLLDEGLEILDESECRRLLGRCSVGRVGVSVGALPAIFPVNYRLIGDAIVFRTGRGTKYDAATRGAVVAFEVDGGLDALYHEGWSVLVVGDAVEVTDPNEAERLAGLLPTPWAEGQRDRVVQVSLELVSGRRIHHYGREA